MLPGDFLVYSRGKRWYDRGKKIGSHGLPVLNGVPPVQGDGQGTVCYLEIGGEEFYGLNSKGRKPEENRRCKDYFNRLKAEGYFEGSYGGGKTQFLTHAEASALIAAHEKLGSLPPHMTIYVDRGTCDFCKNHLPTLMKFLGIETLNIVNLDGNIMLMTAKGGR